MEQQVILTIDEVASLMRLSKRSIYELCSQRGKERFKRNPFPVLRIGDRVADTKVDCIPA